MFSIIGITGRVGGGAAAQLLGMGKDVRAIVRDEKKGRAWADKGASVAVADITDSEALARGLEGSEAVFVMLPPLFDPTPGFPETKQQIDRLRSALLRAKPERVVALSSVGAQVTRPNLLNGLLLLEEGLRALPIPVTFLRPGWFMENHAADVVSAIKDGVIQSYLQPIERCIPMIATTDIGSLAATLLLDQPSSSRVVELEATARVSPEQIASTLSSIIGKPVVAKPVPRDQWESTFLAQGMKNPTPRMQMIDGFNEGWIEFEGSPEGSVKGPTSLQTVLECLVKDDR